MMRTAKISTWFLVVVLLVVLADSAISQSPYWRTLNNAPTASRMDDVFFVSPNTGWIVANGACDDVYCYGNSIWKTTDGGAAWAMQISLGPYLRSVGFVDSLTGWVGAVFNASEVLYQTTDGGANWSLVTNIPDPKPEGIC